MYICMLGSRVDNYLSFLIHHANNEHDCVTHELRGAGVNDVVLALLVEGRQSVRDLLHGQFSPLFDDYLGRLQKETLDDPNNESLIDRNSRLACDLHAHKFVIYRNYKDTELTPPVVKTVIGSFVYLTTRHTWNKACDEGARLAIPETEMYEAMFVLRRRVISWVMRCRQGVCDEVMQTALQMSSSLTGNFSPGTVTISPGIFTQKK